MTKKQNRAHAAASGGGSSSPDAPKGEIVDRNIVAERGPTSMAKSSPHGDYGVKDEPHGAATRAADADSERDDEAAPDDAVVATPGPGPLDAGKGSATVQQLRDHDLLE